MVRTHKNDPRIEFNKQDIKDLKKIFVEKKITTTAFANHFGYSLDYTRKLVRGFHPFLISVFENFVYTFRTYFEENNAEFEKLVKRVRKKNKHLYEKTHSNRNVYQFSS